MTSARARVAALIALFVVFVASVVGTRIFTAVPASPTPSASAAGAASAVTIRRVLVDQVPGGGAVVGSAFDAFTLLAPDGSLENYALAGFGFGTPAFDGADQLAYFSSDALSGGAVRLSVWSWRTKTARVVLDPSAGMRLSAEPVWSADRSSLLTTLVDGTMGAHLLKIDTLTGASTTIADAQPFVGLTPLYADTLVVAIIRSPFGSHPPTTQPEQLTYQLLDARTGAVRVERRYSRSSTETRTAAPGIVAELGVSFESARGPLRVWNVSDPSIDVSRVDATGMEWPAFWPGRTDLVYSLGTTLVALDYTTSRTRTIFSMGEAGRVVGFDGTGEVALLLTDSGYKAVARDGQTLTAIAGARYAHVSSSVYEPVGAIR